MYVDNVSILVAAHSLPAAALLAYYTALVMIELSLRPRTLASAGVSTI